MNKLSKGKLKEVINKPIGSSIQEELVFQVVSVNIKPTAKSTIHLVGFSDGETECSEIFILKKELKRFNIVKISHLDIIEKSSTFIVVKNCEIINDNMTSLIGKPVPITREEASTIVEKSKQISKKREMEKEQKYSNLKNQKRSIAITNIQDTKEPDDIEKTPLIQYHKFHDIDSYSENFILIVRIISISKKDFTSQKGNKGTLANICMIDYDGEELSITVFNKTMEYILEKIEINKVYEISKVSSTFNKQKKKTTSPDFSFYFNETSIIEEVTKQEILKYMPCISKIDIVDIANLNNYEKYDEIDIVVLVVEMEPLELKTFKNGNQNYMKKIKVASSSGVQCELAFFGDFANDFESLNVNVDDVVLFKKLQVREFNKTKNIGSHTNTVVINKENDIKKLCKKEYELLCSLKTNKDKIVAISADQNNNNLKAFKTERDYLEDMIRKSNILFASDSNAVSETYRIIGYALLIRNMGMNSVYPACPTCKKKTIEEEENQFNCSFCRAKVTPKWTWKLSLQVADTVSKIFVQCFGNVGDSLLEMSALDFKNKVTENPEYGNILRNNINFTHKYIFIIKPKMESYNSVSTTKYNLLKVMNLKQNIKSEFDNLLDNLKKKLLLNE